MGSSLRSGRDCRWGEWVTKTLSTLNTTNPQLLPGRRIIGCPLLRVYVHYCVCALGWVKCRAQIPSMGHHTWPHTTSLSLSFPFPLIEGIYPKMKILSLFTHPSLVPNLYFLTSAEHRGRYFEECSKIVWRREKNRGCFLCVVTFELCNLLKKGRHLCCNLRKYFYIRTLMRKHDSSDFNHTPPKCYSCSVFQMSLWCLWGLLYIIQD